MKLENKISKQIFDKIRSKFNNVTLGDEEGNATQNPDEATFFNFDYSVDETSYGNVTISLIDEAMKVFYSKNISEMLSGPDLRDWYGFLQEMRKLAMSNMLRFDVHDISKSRLTINDVKSTVAQADVAESKMYGSYKSSYQKQGPTKIIVRHTESIDPEIRGARSRKVESVFVETHEGERFKMPFKHLPGTRAMASHIGHGGRPWDELGESIITMVNEIAVLRPFIARSRNKIFEDPTTSAMVEASKEYYESTRKTLNRLKGPRGYKQYAENFEPAVECGEFKLEEYKDRFMSKRYNDKMEAAMPVVHKAYNLKENPVTESDGDYYDDMDFGGGDYADEIDDEEYLDGVDHSNNPFRNFDDNEERRDRVDDFMSAGDEFELWADGLIDEAGIDDVQKTTFPTGPGAWGQYLAKNAGLTDDELTIVRGIASGKLDMDDHEGIYEKLFDYYVNNGEMPYGVAKARSGDPYTWIVDELENYLSNDEVEENIDSPHTDAPRDDFDDYVSMDDSALAEDALAEGTWAWPETFEQMKELKELLSKPIPYGPDGQNAINTIYNVVGDDDLADNLYQSSKEFGPEEDASGEIRRYVLQYADKNLEMYLTREMGEGVEMNEDKATYSDYKSAYASQDVSGTDVDSDAKAMVKHLTKQGKKADTKSAKAAAKRMAEAKKQDGLQVNESVKDMQKLAGLLKG